MEFINTNNITMDDLDRAIRQISKGDPDVIICNIFPGDGRRIESVCLAIKESTTLKKFDISHVFRSVSQIASVVAALAPAVRANRSLTTLYFGFNQIGDAGVEALAEAAGNSATMTTLILCGNDITARGAAALVEALGKSKTLTTLNLSHNSIGDAGALLLAAALVNNSRLINLDLSMNNIGDVGAEALLAALESSSSMTDLRLDSDPDIPDITYAVMRRVQAARALAVQRRRIFTLMSAAVPGRPRRGTPAENFVWADGDTALAHRVAEFLFET
jgi:hypothetical protein